MIYSLKDGRRALLDPVAPELIIAESIAGDKSLHGLPRSRIDAAEDVDESLSRLLRQRRAGERCEVGVEVGGVARAGEDDVDARLVAAEAVGGIG